MKSFFLLFLLLCWATQAAAYKIGDVLVAYGGIRYKIVEEIANFSSSPSGYGKIYQVKIENPPYEAQRGSTIVIKIIFSGSRDQVFAELEKLNSRLGSLLSDNINQAPKSLLDFDAPLILDDSKQSNLKILAIPSKLMKGDLFKFQNLFLLQNKTELTTDQKLHLIELMIEQVSEAIEELANHELVHGDIKPANIFLTSTLKDILSGNGRFILGDYDKSPRIKDSYNQSTAQYMPPEVALHPNIPRLPIGDFFSLGMTVVELLFGRKHGVVPDIIQIFEMQKYYLLVSGSEKSRNSMRERTESLFKNAITQLNQEGQTAAAMKLAHLFFFVSASLEFHPRDRIAALSTLHGKFHTTERLLQPWNSDLAKAWPACDKEAVTSAYVGAL